MKFATVILGIFVGTFVIQSVLINQNIARITNAIEAQTELLQDAKNRALAPTPTPVMPPRTCRTPYPENDPLDPICGDPKALKKG